MTTTTAREQLLENLQFMWVNSPDLAAVAEDCAMLALEAAAEIAEAVSKGYETGARVYGGSIAKGIRALIDEVKRA